MSSAASPGSYSQSSVESQDSSSNMSAPSPMSVTLSPQTYQNILLYSPEQAGVCSEPLVVPYLNIIEQPVEKFRFRYKSEMMGTHGSILGRSSDKNRKKTYPTVELKNFDGPAIIRCSLYTAHPNKDHRQPHTHRLVVRHDCEDKDDPHEIAVNRDSGYIATFQGMGIIHTAKKHITEELIKKKKLRLLEKLRSRNMNITGLSTRDEINVRAEAEAEAKKMNLNSVCLCFEAFVRENGVLQPICMPVYSSIINNMKSALTGELKICRIDKHVSSCAGNEEVFILVEKVGKKNIKIKFFELDEEDNEVWCDYGKFSELDVHHQYAIVFRTPPYRDTEIDKTVDVFLQLYRPTDGDCSEPIKFSYKPSDKAGRTRKRARTSLAEDIPVGIVQGYSSNPILSQNGFNHMPPTLHLDEDLSKLETGELFESVLNEEYQHGMNSSEFQDFIRTLSYSSLGSTYSETFGDTIGRDGTSMDISTDGVGKIKSKKRGTQGKEPGIDTSVATKLSRVSIDDKIIERHSGARKEPTSMDGVQLVKWAVTRLNELRLEKPPPNIMMAKVSEIFAKKRDDGDGPLHCAIMNDMHNYVKLMMTILGRGQHRSIINDRNKRDETPLHVAVIQNQPQTVKMLLSFGANPNTATSDGDTPLHLAITNSYEDCITELLNKSNYLRYSYTLDYNLTNYEGWTPLHRAAREKNLSAVKKLVEAGVDVNKPDTKYGRTALHIAVEEGRLDIAQYLLENTKIDVNAANFDGNTALHLAVVHGGPVSGIMVELLMQHKADPRKANHVTENKRSTVTEPIQGIECIEIKEEPESDDDDDYELKIADDESEEEESTANKTHGQTPLDLASNKKDILELLQNFEQSMKNEETEDFVEVKDEPIENPMLEGVLAEVTNGLFDTETLERLCNILDKSQGWVNLAELLDYSFLVPSFRDTASPTKMLFNYADLHGNVSIQDIRGFLEALDEHEAVKVVSVMLSRKGSNMK